MKFLTLSLTILFCSVTFATNMSGGIIDIGNLGGGVPSFPNLDFSGVRKFMIERNAACHKYIVENNVLGKIDAALNSKLASPIFEDANFCKVSLETVRNNQNVSEKINAYLYYFGFREGVCFLAEMDATTKMKARRIRKIQSRLSLSEEQATVLFQTLINSNQ